MADCSIGEGLLESRLRGNPDMNFAQSKRIEPKGTAI